MYFQDCFGWSGKYHLFTRIKICHYHFRKICNVIFQFFNFAHHSQHASGIKIWVIRSSHRLSPGIGQLVIVNFVYHSCRPERCQFTETVTCCKINSKPFVTEQAKKAGTDCSNYRLCVFCQLEPGFLLFSFLIIKNCNWKNQV